MTEPHPQALPTEQELDASARARRTAALPHLSLARLEQLMRGAEPTVAALYVSPRALQRLAAAYRRTEDAQYSATVRACGIRICDDERLPDHYAETRDRTGAVVARFAFTPV
jgi:hypothetical protein